MSLLISGEIVLVGYVWLTPDASHINLDKIIVKKFQIIYNNNVWKIIENYCEFPLTNNSILSLKIIIILPFFKHYYWKIFKIALQFL